MAKHDAIFEEHYVYNEKSTQSYIDKLDLSWVDCYMKYQIHPVRNGRGFSYEVTHLDDYPMYETTVFRSKKKAMQYVVAELFTELFDYEHYGFKKHKGLL